MQLSQLYSDQVELFPHIRFNCGERSNVLNVVFARVDRPKDSDKDSHNLGKTTLIHLLDFCLLKEVSETPAKHFLVKNRSRFEHFVFFLEVLAHDGSFVTIRRGVSDFSAVSIKRHSEKTVLLGAPDDGWDHFNIAISSAKEILDATLNLSWLSPWTYRTGVTYFMRAQTDYLDPFQIGKFVKGKDRDWKPYLAKVFGLDHESAYDKYAVDQEIEEKEATLTEQRLSAGADKVDRNALNTRIVIKSDELAELELRLDRFDFSKEELRLNKELVNEVEARSAATLDEIYNLDYDLAQIRKALDTGFKFDIGKIATVFEESSVVFPDALRRSYDELAEFNKKLTRDRNAALRAQKKVLEEQREKAVSRHEALNLRRQELLKVVQGADTFDKYKALQRQVAKNRQELSEMVTKREKLDQVAVLEKNVRELGQQRSFLIDRMDASLRADSAIRSEIVRLFNRYAMRVLNIHGEFLVRQNGEGNYNFEIKTKDASGMDTAQADGNSYGHLLCALFDLAVLKALEDQPFYHFVYHDGLLEALDNRKKLRVLELVRECVAGGKIQYILSAIDADLPRDQETEEKIPFKPEELVLQLNDTGDTGRLFKMPPF